MLTQGRNRRRFGWALFVALLVASTALRFVIVPWSPPIRLTFSQSPVTDEAWQEMTAQNQVRNPNYVPKPLTQRMDRVRALWPLIHASNFATAKFLGLGVLPRRRVAFALSSLLFCALAWVVSRGGDPFRACLVLLLAGASFPLAYFYRVGLGYELVAIEMFTVLLLLTGERPRLWRLLLAGAGCGLTVATYFNALPFGATCALWLLLPEKAGDQWPGRDTWLRWLAFGSAALLSLGLVFALWTYPNGGFDPELFRGRTPGSLLRLVTSLSHVALFPMRLHEPFLLALFTYLGLTHLFAHGLYRSRHSFLILWATVWLAYIAVLPYQPLRYLQFCLLPMVLFVADKLSTPAPQPTTRVRAWLPTLAASLPLLLACLPQLNGSHESLFAAWTKSENLKLLAWLWWTVPLGSIAVRVLAARWSARLAHNVSLGYLLCGFLLCNAGQFIAWQQRQSQGLLTTQAQLAAHLATPRPTLVDLSAMPYVQAAQSPIYVFDERYIQQYTVLGIRSYVTTARGDARMRRYLKALGVDRRNEIAHVAIPGTRTTLDVIRRP